MRHWHDVLPLAIVEVTLEDLVEQREQVSAQLITACGLSPRGSDASVATRQAIPAGVRAGIGRWTNYRHHLGEAIAVLGSH